MQPISMSTDFSNFLRMTAAAWPRAIFLALLLASPALAFDPPVYTRRVSPGLEVSGRASTELQWRQESRRGDYLPAYQYLLLNLRDFDQNLQERQSFHAYGRLGTDLANKDDNADSRLYYAYYEKQRLLDDQVDIRLGRQFVAITAGASLMDGMTVDYRPGGRFSYRLFGGGDVAFYTGYNAKDTIVGGEMRGRFMDDSLLTGFSYAQRREDADLATELIGADFDYGFRKLLNLYGEIQYDRLSDRVSYGLVGGNYHGSDRWGLRAEYLYSLPVFSSTSIYSVFAVSKYQEAMAEANYSFGPGHRVFGRYSREIYEDFTAADVFEAGVEKIRTDRFSGSLSGIWRLDKDGQDLHGARIRAAWLMTEAIQAGLGAEIDVLQRRLDEFEDDTISTRYWAYCTARLRRDLELQARLERAESDGFWGYENRGTLRVNVIF